MEPSEEAISKIKNIEERGKIIEEKAEQKKNATIDQARKDAILLVENFEKSRNDYIKRKVEKAEEEQERKSRDIIKKAQKGATALKTKAMKNVTSAVNYLFGEFKKEVLRD